MDDLALGLFPDFKGARTVLLCCTKRGIEQLRQLVGSAAQGRVAVHSYAMVAPNHPVKLFCGADVAEDGFTWLVSADRVAVIDAALGALSEVPGGHQCFELANGASAQLMVSAGEYDTAWWATHA